MKKRTAILILAGAIICSFFFPIFNWHSFEMSGLNYILSTHIPSYKYVLLLIPFSSLLLLGGASNEEKYLFNSRILSLIPLLTLVFVLIARSVPGNSENNYYDSESFFSTINIGFWMVIFFSVLLFFVRDGKKVSY